MQWLSVNGLIATDLAASIRANAGALDRALPTDPTGGAGNTGAAGDDDDDKEDDEGPSVEPFVGLRVA